jgi:hypothetical protein
MDIFDKVKTKKSADKVKKKTKKKEKTKKTEEVHENGTVSNPAQEVVHDDGWADEVGIDEVEVVQAKLKTNVQMTNMADDKDAEDDGNKDDWANKDNKPNESEEDSTEKTETSTENNTTTANSDAKPAESAAAKPAGKFVPRHLRGGTDSGPSLRDGISSSSLINQGLRGPGGRFMRNKEPPKTESHAEFPTLGAAMKEMSTKVPEGFEKVQNDVRGYRGGNDNAGNQNLSTSNKFGAFGS